MPYALITGSAKGIGKSIAIELAKKGYNVLLTDIDEGSLEETAEEIRQEPEVQVYTLVKDLQETNSFEEIYEWTSPYHDSLEIVVSNAGYGLTGKFEALSLEQQLGIVDVNIKATVALSYRFIPVLKQKAKAHLVITGSTTAYQSVPYLAVYAASKAFILSFTRSIRYELKNTGIKVSCLVPGPTDTAWVKRAGIGKHTLKTADIFNMSPDDVARIGVNGFLKGRAEIITGVVNKLNAFFPKFFPKKLVESIGAGIYDPKKNSEEQHEKILHSKQQQVMNF